MIIGPTCALITKGQEREGLRIVERATGIGRRIHRGAKCVVDGMLVSDS